MKIETIYALKRAGRAAKIACAVVAQIGSLIFSCAAFAASSSFVKQLAYTDAAIMGFLALAGIWFAAFLFVFVD